jgi:serine/threonine-protein kinase RsbW
VPVPPRRITLEIESRLEQVAMIAAALRAVCGLTNLPADQIDELELGVVEAVNNVIRHGYGGAPGMPVAVAVTLGDDRVEVEIRDRGVAIPAGLLDRAGDDLPDPDPTDIGSLPESGMGLRLIRAVASRVRYDSRGGENTLRLEKLLSSGAPAS